MAVETVITALLLASSQPVVSEGPQSSDTSDPADAATGADSEIIADPEIVVEAPPTPLERQRELKKMVATIMRKPRVGRTIATFKRAPCPKVFGLPEEAAERIEKRILQNAKELDANPRKPQKNCRHNVSIIFVPQSEGPPESWFDYDSDELKHLLSFERFRVLNEKDPVRAWSYDVVRSADGFDIPDASGRRLDQIADFSNQLPYASRLLSPIQMEIAGAVVVISLDAANGKALDQLADYATMRALANLGGLDPDTPPAAPTILTLFQDDNPPDELTNFDRAFVTKLYQANPNYKTNRYHSVIAARAAKDEREAGLAPGQSDSQ